MDSATVAWVPGPELSEERFEHCVAVFRGELWAVGGIDSNGEPSKSCEGLDAASNQWVPGLDMLCQRHQFRLAVFRDQLWAIGEGESRCHTSEYFDAATNTWMEGPAFGSDFNNPSCDFVYLVVLNVMTWAVTAFSDATVSLDVISRCTEKNILVMPKSSKGEELHSAADLARYDVAWRKHNNLAEQSYSHLNPLDAVLPVSKRAKPKKGEARPEAAPAPTLPVPPTGPTVPEVERVAQQEVGKERFHTERFLGLMCRAVNGGNVDEGAALQVKLAKHGFNTATRLANWWAPGMAHLNQCETKMVEKIIEDWKEGVDVEDVAGSAMYYALKHISK